MKKLINTSLALALVSALGLAATGSAFAEGGQGDFDAEMQRAPQSQGIYTEPGSMQQQRQMQYTPRNIEGSSAGIVGVVTLEGSGRRRRARDRRAEQRQARELPGNGSPAGR